MVLMDQIQDELHRQADYLGDDHSGENPQPYQQADVE